MAITMARLQVPNASDGDASSAFHALKRENADAPPPTREEVGDWVKEQFRAVATTGASPARRGTIGQRLLAARMHPERYDGPTFAAMKGLAERLPGQVRLREVDASGMFGGGLKNCGNCGQFTGRFHVCPRSGVEADITLPQPSAPSGGFGGVGETERYGGEKWQVVARYQASDFGESHGGAPDRRTVAYLEDGTARISDYFRRYEADISPQQVVNAPRRGDPNDFFTLNGQVEVDVVSSDTDSNRYDVSVWYSAGDLGTSMEFCVLRDDGESDAAFMRRVHEEIDESMFDAEFEWSY